MATKTNLDHMNTNDLSLLCYDCSDYGCYAWVRFYMMVLSMPRFVWLLHYFSFRFYTTVHLYYINVCIVNGTVNIQKCLYRSTIIFVKRNIKFFYAYCKSSAPADGQDVCFRTVVLVPEQQHHAIGSMHHAVAQQPI